MKNRIRIAHVTPAKGSLDILLQRRLKILTEYGYENYGLSGTFAKDVKKTISEVYKYFPVQNLTREMNLIKDFRATMEMQRIFEREKFDIVATYGPKPGLYGRIAARLAGIESIVHTSWGLLFTEKSSLQRKAIYLTLEAIAAQFGDGVLSVNSDDIRYLNVLERYKIAGRRDRVERLGNACDLEYFNRSQVEEKEVESKRASWGVRKEEIVVGIVGRIVAEKGYNEFIEAAKIIRRRKKNVRFVAIGSQDREKEDAIPLEKIESAGIHIAGFDNEIRRSYASMDIMVLPSHREGFPRSLVEASSMELPIVTTDSRGCREAIWNGESGFLVPVGDSVQLIIAIERFVESKELRERFGKMGRKKAEEEYDEKELVKRMVGTYERYLK